MNTNNLTFTGILKFALGQEWNLEQNPDRDTECIVEQVLAQGLGLDKTKEK